VLLSTPLHASSNFTPFLANKRELKKIIRLALKDPSILINNCMDYSGAQLNKNQLNMKSTHKSYLTYFCYDSGLSSVLSDCISPVSDKSHD
jgi:hypothetical protein